MSSFFGLNFSKMDRKRRECRRRDECARAKTACVPQRVFRLVVTACAIRPPRGRGAQPPPVAAKSGPVRNGRQPLPTANTKGLGSLFRSEFYSNIRESARRVRVFICVYAYNASYNIRSSTVSFRLLCTRITTHSPLYNNMVAPYALALLLLSCASSSSSLCVSASYNPLHALLL